MLTLRRTLLALSGLLLLVSLSGCESLGRINPFGGDKEKEEEEKPAELMKFDAEVDVKKEWGASIGEGTGGDWTALQPALASGYVIAADAFGHVEAREIGSGKRAWKVSVGRVSQSLTRTLTFWKSSDSAFVSAGVGGNDDLVLIGTEMAEVVALNAGNGNEVWRTRVSSEIGGTPALGSDVVAVPTIDGKLVVLDRATGARQWSHDTQVPVLTLRGDAPPVVVQDAIFAGFATGHVVSLGVERGNIRWQQRISLPQGRSELGRIVDVNAPPLVADNGLVYAVNYQGAMKALNAEDGQELWELEVSSYQPLARGFGNVYVVTERGHIVAVDERQGTVVWRQEGLDLRTVGAPVAFSNYVVVSDREGYLHVFAQVDGRPLGRRKIGGDGFAAQPLVSDSVIYGLTRKGDLMALTIDSK